MQELWYWLEEDLLSCPIVIVTIINRRRYNGSTTSTNRSTVVRGDKDDYDNLVNPARLIRFCKKKDNDSSSRRWWRHERPISLHSSRNIKGQTTMSTMGITVVWCMIKQIADLAWHIPWYRWCHHNRDMKNVPDHDESSLRPVTDRKCFLLLWIKIKTKSWDRLLNVLFLLWWCWWRWWTLRYNCKNNNATVLLIMMVVITNTNTVRAIWLDK